MTITDYSEYNKRAFDHIKENKNFMKCDNLYNQVINSPNKYKAFSNSLEEFEYWKDYISQPTALKKEKLFNKYVCMIIYKTCFFLSSVYNKKNYYKNNSDIIYDTIFVDALDFLWSSLLNNYDYKSSKSFGSYCTESLTFHLKGNLLNYCVNNTLFTRDTYRAISLVYSYMNKSNISDFDECFKYMSDEMFKSHFTRSKQWFKKFVLNNRLVMISNFSDLPLVDDSDYNLDDGLSSECNITYTNNREVLKYRTILEDINDLINTKKLSSSSTRNVWRDHYIKKIPYTLLAKKYGCTAHVLSSRVNNLNKEIRKIYIR